MREDDATGPEPETPPRVLLSYSHDSPEHARRVLELAQRLRDEGIDAIIDQFDDAPAEGWPRWMLRQIREADFIVVIASAGYRAKCEDEVPRGLGRGVKWESHLTLQELYDDGGYNYRYVPVLFDDASERDLPRPLAASTIYELPQQYDDLYRRLTGQRKVIPVPLGQRRALPAISGPGTPASTDGLDDGDGDGDGNGRGSGDGAGAGDGDGSGDGRGSGAGAGNDDRRIVASSRVGAAVEATPINAASTAKRPLLLGLAGLATAGLVAGLVILLLPDRDREAPVVQAPVGDQPAAHDVVDTPTPVTIQPADDPSSDSGQPPEPDHGDDQAPGSEDGQAPGSEDGSAPASTAATVNKSSGGGTCKSIVADQLRGALVQRDISCEGRMKFTIDASGEVAGGPLDGTKVSGRSCSVRVQCP